VELGSIGTQQNLMHCTCHLSAFPRVDDMEAVDLLLPTLYAHMICRCKWKNKKVGTFLLDTQIMGVSYTNYEIHPQTERNAPARCGG
jgi:hypothetical protein